MIVETRASSMQVKVDRWQSEEVTRSDASGLNDKAWMTESFGKMNPDLSAKTEAKGLKAPESASSRRMWGGRPVKTLDELAKFGRGYGAHPESEPEA